MSVDDVRPESPTPAPQPGGWARYRKRLLASVPVIVIAIGVVVYRYVATQNGISGAPAGSCASVEGTGNDTTYAQVDCGDPKATLTVLAQLPQNQDCRDVAGADQSTIDGKYAKLTCFGPKGADPATSTNTAAEGECVTAKGDLRTPCTDPTAAFTILKRINGVAENAVGASCDNVEGTSRVADVGWTRSSSLDGFGTGTVTDYTVLCLAPVTR